MKQYIELLKTIQRDGTHKDAARANMPGTTSLFGYQFRHDLNEGFPLLTTKKMFWKGIVVELLWFLRGDTNIKYLLDHGVNIWNEDAYNYFRKVQPKNYPPFSFEAFINTLKGAGHSEYVSEGASAGRVSYILGDCGYQYGQVWRAWGPVKGNGKVSWIDQIQTVINGIKANPLGRRHIVTAWDPSHDQDLALTWCHAMFQFNCRPMDEVTRAHWAVDNNKMHRSELMMDDEQRTLEQQLDDHNIPRYYLDCQLYQRSADVILGVPFNIASYALLVHIIAKMCKMAAGAFIHTFGDVHCYEDHQEAVEEQLKRQPKGLPRVELSDDVNWTTANLDDTLAGIEELGWEKVFNLLFYNPHPSIKAKLSTGLK